MAVGAAGQLLEPTAAKAQMPPTAAMAVPVEQARLRRRGRRPLSMGKEEPEATAAVVAEPGATPMSNGPIQVVAIHGYLGPATAHPAKAAKAVRVALALSKFTHKKVRRCQVRNCN